MSKNGEYKSELAAKRAANKNLNSVIVCYRDGSFDWFPHGSPVGEFNSRGNFQKARPGVDYVNIAQYSTSRGRWEAIPDLEEEEFLTLEEEVRRDEEFQEWRARDIAARGG